MNCIYKYLRHLQSVRRYSKQTSDTYAQVFASFTSRLDLRDDDSLISSLTPANIRGYMVYLLDEMKMSTKSVNLHLSVLSGFCHYLQQEGLLDSNPVKLIPRPKLSKKLPTVYRQDSMTEYFQNTEMFANRDAYDRVQGNDKHSLTLWLRRRDRLIMRLLYDTGIRRSELISLTNSSIDCSRQVLRVKGKGNKMREIPLSDAILKEILLYLLTTAKIWGSEASPSDPLVITERGAGLYPMAVQRIVETELGSVGVTGRRSPHALRHTIATELLDEGSDLNSIKELLGHSSLAATQVYTHTSVDKLKKSYINAHPRAKRGG